MDNEAARIRGYLQAQAAKRSPARLVDDVREAMTKLERAALAVPESRFGERPATEEWSADEVLAHVVEAGRHFGDQVLAILDRAAPAPQQRADAPERRADAPERREPPASDGHPAHARLTVLRHDRDVLFERVLRADPDAGLDVRIEHRMFGPLNWREVILFTRLHDLDHAGQLEQITAVFTTPRPV